MRDVETTVTEPAGFPRRLCAYLVDVVVVGAPILVALGLVGAGKTLRDLVDLAVFNRVPEHVLRGSSVLELVVSRELYLRVLIDLLPALLVMFLGSSLWMLYRIWTTAHGTSVGKRLFGMRVVRVDDRSTPGWAVALRRFLVPQGLGLLPIPGTGLLAYASSLRRQDRRGLHDQAAGTIVLRVRPARHVAGNNVVRMAPDRR